MKVKFYTLSLILFCLDSESQNLFELVPSSYSNVNFINQIQETKKMNVLNYEYMYNGAGVAIGDIDNDGLKDILFSANMAYNKLYLNKGNLKFEDISETAKINTDEGFNTGITLLDLNGDGWLDIYICKSAFNIGSKRIHNLYINNQDKTFTDKAIEYGLADSSFSSQAYFYDFDKDGDLDLFLLNHPEKMGEAKKIILTNDENGKLVPKKPNSYTNETNRYLENINGKFIDKTKVSGIQNYAFGLSAVVADFNLDGYADIYIANDYTQPDFLYLNNRNGTFTDSFDNYFNSCSYHSMGSDYADLDNDGLDDLVVLDMLPENNYRQKLFKQQINYDQYEKLIRYGFKSQFVKNVVQWNKKKKKFVEISNLIDASFTDWSWTPLIADFDNNGWKDLYITNGYLRDVTDLDIAKYNSSFIQEYNNVKDDPIEMDKYLSVYSSVKIPNYFYSNQGNMKFIKNPAGSGLEAPSFSNGAAYGDLDNDGDLEIVVNNINQEAFVLKNNSTELKLGNYLRFELNSANNSRLYGTKIEIETPDNINQTLTYYPTKGFLSCHEHALHFGVGKNAIINQANISLTNGQSFKLSKIQANQLIKINIDTLSQRYYPKLIKNTLDFENITKSCFIDYKHIENIYNDFKQEPLLPKKYSRLGPAIAVGDINNDKLEDIFIGGALGQEAFFYIQIKDGKFQKLTQKVFFQDKTYEDVNSSFFDYDLDGDQDLIVVSGGNDYPNNLNKYPVRLYINLGNLQFVKADSSVFPQILTSSKAIAIEDYDKNGYLDVFIGGKIVPGQYGQIPFSYLFKNNGKKFLQEELASNGKLGMISDAVWVDIDKNGFKDLILVGEWMNPTIIKNNNGNLSPIPENLVNLKGWWTSISATDINQDGFQDFILGNYGVNSRYTGTQKTPMFMFVNDFDKNGTTDAIINTFVEDNYYPVHNRDILLDQLTFLKKKFNRYAIYAKADAFHIFTEEEMAKTDTLVANYMYSCILYGNAKNSFDVKKLPIDAQIFPVLAVNTLDLDNDQDLDLILAGNDYHLEIESGRMDAGQGLILENIKNQSFKALTNTNFKLDGDVKVIRPILINNTKAFIVGINDGEIQVLQMKKRN